MPRSAASRSSRFPSGKSASRLTVSKSGSSIAIGVPGAGRLQHEVLSGRGGARGPTCRRPKSRRFALAELDGRRAVGLAHVVRAVVAGRVPVLVDENRPAVVGEAGELRPVEPGEVALGRRARSPGRRSRAGCRSARRGPGRPGRCRERSVRPGRSARVRTRPERVDGLQEELRRARRGRRTRPRRRKGPGEPLSADSVLDERVGFPAEIDGHERVRLPRGPFDERDAITARRETAGSRMPCSESNRSPCRAGSSMRLRPSTKRTIASCLPSGVQSARSTNSAIERGAPPPMRHGRERAGARRVRRESARAARSRARPSARRRGDPRS